MWVRQLCTVIRVYVAIKREFYKTCCLTVASTVVPVKIRVACGVLKRLYTVLFSLATAGRTAKAHAPVKFGYRWMLQLNCAAAFVENSCVSSLSDTNVAGRLAGSL